ncbi:MAG TPA: C13 family peptidase, partial [Candidatus Binatia bacterium]|nr:C13 family peptidase [Candidatus Binatia bacterium]
KLAAFCAVPADRIPVSWWQVAAFGLVSLLLPLVYDSHSIGTSGQFAWDAVPAALVHLPILLFASIAVTYSLGRSETTLLLLQTFLMIAAAIDVTVYVLSLAPTPHTQRLVKILSYKGELAPTVWLALACGKAAADYLAVSIPHRVLAYGLCATLIVLPLTPIHRDRGLWQQVRHDGELRSTDARRKLDEDVFYQQPKVLERELAAVKPGHRGLIDVYFIGIGGFADQDVFMKEIDAVSRLFQERFGTAGKTIRLVNNRKTLSSSPVASVTSLRAALKRVAEVMDTNEDVLFLFLTSHGSATHRFSLELRPLRLQELEPEKLRELLDESGIRNRVVIVSACYSGGFVSSLKDENTLVISASAPDKNSFGCSNEAEWTYFGKAYFDEALRKTHSFVEAFELAKPVIAEWERKEGHVASDPQIYLGESIKPKLLKLTRQLDSQLNGVSR